jgi:Zn-dependent protease
MRKDSWDLGTWGRIPVTMHWTVLLSFAWLYIFFLDVLATAIGAVALFLLFIAHEYGHVLVLRRRRIAVTGIAFFGLHGETSYNEYAAKAGDEVAVAWGGVAAQLVVMLLAIAATELIPFASIPFGPLVWGPMYFVFLKFNVLLMIIALLPIGPFDGHAAWKAIPRMRAKMKARPAPKARAAAPPPEPEPEIPDERQRELDRNAEKEAAALIAKLTGKSGASADDR